MPVRSEFDIIQQFFSADQEAPGLQLGPGDDSALLVQQPGYSLAVSVDTMVEGTHFFPGQSAHSVGYRAAAAALSDLAAMGANPLGILLALTLPDLDEHWISEFSQGLRALLIREKIPLIGGDTTRGPRAVSITVLGEVPPGQALRRQGACPGNLVVVSGFLGGASVGLAEAMQQVEWEPVPASRPDCPPDSALQRYLYPEPRLALGKALTGTATAAIDLSDGLLADLAHVCKASGCGAQLLAHAIPQHPSLSGYSTQEAFALTLTGGDEYELVFAWPEEHAQALTRLATELRVELTVIGRFVIDPGIILTDASGEVMEFTGVAQGFDHFAAS